MMPRKMDVTVAGVDRLQALQGQWRELMSRSGQNEPTLAPEWVVTWCSVFGKLGDRAIHVAELREAGRLTGLAPLVSRRRRHRGMLDLRRLELACSGEPEQDEILSEYVGVIAERGTEDAVARALVEAITAGRFGAVDEFGIPAMNSEDPMGEVLVRAFAAAGWRAELTPDGLAPHARLPSTWQDYLAGLGSRRRHAVRRAERNLEQWAGGRPTLRVAKNNEDLATGRALLQRLHTERWQAVDLTGAFASSAFTDFHASVMPRLLERGVLELLWLEASGEPIAILYNIVWNDKVYNYQSGRRMDLPGSIRPGLAIHAATIRRAIDLGRREYDFLGGAHQYKRDFSTALRPLVALNAVRPGTRDTIRRLLDRAAEVARRGRRSSPASHPPRCARS